MFLGRQAIYDVNRNIHGHELLYRREGTEGANVVDGNRATAQVFLNTLIHIGIENVSPSAPLFINCTREFLLADQIIPPDRCVLEILEDIELDDEVVNRMLQLRESGYRLALDDFIYDDTVSSAVQLADYIKVDVLAFSKDELGRQVKVLRRNPVLLIAEKIESEAQLALCRDLGFDLFQGYYLRRPDLLSGKRIKTNQLSALNLINECQNPNASISAISATVTADLSMTYNLLRMANSAMFGGLSKVESISQAIARLGMNRIIRLAAILSLASDSDCPKGYLECALQRAYMCELLSMAGNTDSPDSFFLVGLLSLLDSIMQTPMSAILPQLPLTSKIQDALLNHSGEMGRVLDAVIAYEAGDWNGAMNSRINEDSLRSAYWLSVESASTTLRSIG